MRSTIDLAKVVVLILFSGNAISRDQNFRYNHFLLAKEMLRVNEPLPQTIPDKFQPRFLNNRVIDFSTACQEFFSCAKLYCPDASRATLTTMQIYTWTLAHVHDGGGAVWHSEALSQDWLDL